jgi:hypothetical protein
MLQRAMDLKQKKNLDHNRGNSFSVLQNDTLNNIATDINVKIVKDKRDKDRIINILVQSERDNVGHFVEENSDILLPTDIDLQDSLGGESLKDSEGLTIQTTPEGSIKELETLLWTEVDRKGKNRNKTKSRNVETQPNERGLLEY